MASDQRRLLDRKLEALFPSASEREAATALLEAIRSDREGDRVALAVLKLAGSDPAKVAEYVEAAKGDYRDVLAWAEYPRQMKLGPSASSPAIAQARQADAAEYRRWLADDRRA